MELNWMWMITAIFLVGYVHVFIFYRTLNDWYYALKLGKKQYLLPPGNMGWPLLGDILSLMRIWSSDDPNSFINNLAARYGRSGIYKTHLLGNPCIIVCAPDICRRVLTDNKNFKLGYPKSIEVLLRCRPLGDVSNDEHKRMRRLVTAPIIGHSALALYFERVQDIIVNSLEELASVKHPVEILNEMNKISFKIIVHIFIGSRNQFIVNKIGDNFNHMIEGLSSLPINVPGFAFRKGLKARKNLVSILQPIVDERRKMTMESSPQGGKKDLMDILLQVEDESGKKLENEDIMALLVVFLFAGSETTATAMMWCLIYLTENPQILQRAKEEQEEIVKTRPPSQKQLSIKEVKQMVYLAKVIDEMLRRTNIAFSPFREAATDVEINGYIIPKGWRVLIWTKAIHLDPDYYINPLEFNPSRWEDNNAKAGTFFPFGGGTRHCPGSDLAKLEISIFLHYFLINYRLERVNPGCSISYHTVVKPTDNCLAKLIKNS